jgi:putative ABC transport system permease protein
MSRDLAFAFRSLRRRPAFSAAVVLTLALGLGASMAIFSLVDAALLRPFPFTEPERLTFLWGVAGPERDVRGASFLEAKDWGTRNRTLVGLSVYDNPSINLRTDDGAERIEAEWVSASYFSLLGATPALGRTFLPEEDEVPERDAVVVLSHSLWANRFGADSSIVGRAVTLNDRPYTVVGVMPEGFRGLSYQAEAWVPSMMIGVIGEPSMLERRGSRWIGAIARLRPGVTAEEAQRDLDRVAATLAADYPETNTDRGVQLLGLREYYLGDLRGLLFLLLGAVTLFLLVACANVTSLQLVRATARSREIGVRLALGADRGQLVRQLLTESVVLALAGGAAGLLLALWLVDVVPSLLPEGLLPPYIDVVLDGRVLAAGAALCVGCGIAVGLAPALRATRQDPGEALKSGGRSAASAIGAIGRPRLQQAIVVAEVAIAIVLLVSAGLMARSFANRLGVDPGFRPEGVLAVRVTLPRERYDTEARNAFTDELLDRVRVLPGVADAALGSDLPLRGLTSAATLVVDHRADDRVRFYVHKITPDYFRTLGIPLLQGRSFTPTDRPGTPAVVVVTEAMAKRFWPDGDAVGRRIRLGGADGPEHEVVGVVRTPRFRDLTTDLGAARAEPDVFFPLAQRGDRTLEIALRSRVEPASLTKLVRAAVTAMDPGVPVYAVQSLADVVRQQTATSRFGSATMSAFSVLALLLAAIGIYGLLAFLVSLGTRDIAIRMALGAGAARVQRLVVGQGMALVAIGVVLGLAGALAAARALSSQLFGVSPTDPVTLGAVGLTVLVAALAASWIPARRASRVDPQTILRGE